MDRSKGNRLLRAGLLCLQSQRRLVADAGTRAAPYGKNASPIIAAETEDYEGAGSVTSIPVTIPMFEKARVRAFIAFIAKYGENKLLDCLERNEAAGMLYHDDGRITGGL